MSSILTGNFFRMSIPGEPSRVYLTEEARKIGKDSHWYAPYVALLPAYLQRRNESRQGLFPQFALSAEELGRDLEIGLPRDWDSIKSMPSRLGAAFTFRAPADHFIYAGDDLQRRFVKYQTVPLEAEEIAAFYRGLRQRNGNDPLRVIGEVFCNSS